jgi:hypothetical protein
MLFVGKWMELEIINIKPNSKKANITYFHSQGGHRPKNNNIA